MTRIKQIDTCFASDGIAYVAYLFPFGEVKRFVQRLNGQFGVGQCAGVDVGVAVNQAAARVGGDGIERELVKTGVVVLEVHEAAGAEDAAVLFVKKSRLS